jgi:AcrR family transcriptional regulator
MKMRGMRADARRNRERILAAARDVFVARGPDAPLDAIAAVAGVGIGTLYRRFPDRRALVRAVVLDVLGRAAEEARLAQAEEPDAFHALARYLHRALDLRISAVMPELLDDIPPDDEDIAAIRARSWGLFQQLVDRAHAAGTLRPDATFADIGVLLVRLARPVPGPIPRDLDNRLAHRHLELLLDGLRADRAAPVSPLPEPALTLADLLAPPDLTKAPEGLRWSHIGEQSAPVTSVEARRDGGRS